jgi:hypothetical protein
VGITNDNGKPKVDLGMSSGYPDLDAASLEVALLYFTSGKTSGARIIAVRWALSKDRPSRFAGGPVPKPGGPKPPADAPVIVKGG